MKRQKRAWLLLLCLALLLTACAPTTQILPPEESEASVQVGSALTVYFLNIKSADCILLKTDSHLVIIDTGEVDDGDRIVEAVGLLGAQMVDCLILSHPDKDHIGGAPALLATGMVQTLYQPDFNKGSNEQALLRDAIAASSGTTALTVDEVTRFLLDEVTFTIYPTFLPLRDGEEDSNLSSLGVLVEHGNNRLFFAGDAVDERIPEMLAQLEDPSSIDLLKVPHHGRFNNHSDMLIEAAMPSIAVICCDHDEPPDNRIMRLLDGVGADNFLTSHGIVVVTSDGNRLIADQ